MNNIRKKAIILALFAVFMFTFASCSAEMKVIGLWNIKSIEAGEESMTAADLKEFGITEMGSIKLRKSGKCDLNLLGDEYEGTWTFDEGKGEVSISYGKDLTATGVIDGKTMTVTDSNGSVYTLKK